MSTTPTSASMPPPPPPSAAPAVDEDTFERDLKEMLKDAPSLNDLSSTVQGGSLNVDGKPQAYIRPDNQSQRANNLPGQMSSGSGTSMPRSPSVPPGDSLGCIKYGVMRPECSPVATSNIPLSSPERNGNLFGGPAPGAKGTVSQPSSKLDTLKSWTINTYKCTRQMVSERFGKGSRTVDLELEAQIEALRDTQRKYANVLRLARAMTNHFYHVVQTQRAMGDCFAELSQKSPELQEEFAYNSETQKALAKNGEVLLGALNFFTSSVNTLCNKTMEDTLQTIKQYETARVEYDAYRSELKLKAGVEYDAYRTDMEALQLGPRDSNTMPKIEDAQRKFSHHKEKYDRLRGDVAIKLKFLEENKVKVSEKQLYHFQTAIGAFVNQSQKDVADVTRQFKVKVMHKQLLLFHNAIAAYFTGNQSALEATLKQFNIKLKAPNTEKPSWIEQN